MLKLKYTTYVSVLDIVGYMFDLFCI